MSDMQFFVSVAVMPVTTIIIVLIGVLLNNSNMNNRINDVMARISDLRAEMDRRFTEMDRRFAAIERRLDSVEAKIDLLTGKVIEFDNRLTRVEAHLGLK
jgi:septal ring factor EnvC (AmiA/AmiB activator)